MSRGLAPSTDGGGGLGIPSVREWGHVATKELWVAGHRHFPPSAESLTAGGDIDMQVPCHLVTLSADAAFTFDSVEEPLTTRVVVKGAADHAFSFAGVTWSTLFPAYLIPDVPFVFDFLTFDGDIVGVFHGTFSERTVALVADATPLTDLWEGQFFFENRAQLHSVIARVTRAAATTDAEISVGGSSWTFPFHADRRTVSVTNPVSTRIVNPATPLAISVVDNGGTPDDGAEGLTVTARYLHY